MKPYPLELRLRVVAAYEEGQGTIAEIAALFHVGVTFIKKMIGRSRNGESLEPKHGGGAEPSLNEVNLEVLRAAVETHPDATLGELKWFLRTDRGVKVSLATICRALQKLKLGRKKKGLVASERNNRKREAFRRKIADWDVHQFVFVDEMGTNLSLTRLYGRAEPGVRVIDAVPSGWGENYSTIGALALDGMRAAMSVPGSIDGDVLLLFVKQSLCLRLRPGDIVYMDNVPTHKMVAITGAIESVGARVEFLPEYSPDFSPIEPFWSKVKKVVRDFGPRTVIKLFAALKQAFATVTLKDILGFFAHCGYKVAPT